MEDNRDGFRLFCGLGLVPRTVDRLAAWKGGVITDFAAAPVPTCATSAPSSAALVLRAVESKSSLSLVTVAWWYAALVSVVVATVAWAVGVGPVARRGARHAGRAPGAAGVARILLSTYGDPAGLVGTLAVACGIAALLVTAVEQRATRTVALVRSVAARWALLLITLYPAAPTLRRGLSELDDIARETAGTSRR